MATSDSDKQTKASATDDDLEGTSKLSPADSGAAKLRKLLAKSRAVAGSLSEASQSRELPELNVEPLDDDDDDEAEAMTEVASIPDVSAALESLEPEEPAGQVEQTSPEVEPPAAVAAAAAALSPPPPMPATASQAGPRFPTAANPTPPLPSPSSSYIGPLPSQSGMYQTNVPLNPTGEFGIIPDIGMQSRDDIPVASSKTPTDKSRRRRAFFVTLLIGVIAVAIIARLVVDRWVAPTQAIVWTAAGTLIPTLLVGFMLAWPNRDRLSLRDFLAAMIPAVAVSAGAIFLSTFWMQPHIRVLAVPFAPESPTLMSQVLEDPSDRVGAAGCQRFASFYDQPQYRTLLFSALTLRPELTMKCINELPPETQSAVAASVADRWTRELLADQENPETERLCASAGGLATLPLERATLGARLLQCTLSAPSSEVQTCCGESLTATVVDANQWGKHLRESISLLRDDYTAIGVFAMAFHQQNLTPAQKKFSETVNFTGPRAQAAALEFACAAIADGRTDVIPHMRAALENDECEIDPSEVPTTRSLWQEVCLLTLAELEGDKTLPPQTTMCRVATDIGVAAAVDTAQRLVFLARQRDVEGKLAQRIDSGYDKLLLDNALANDEDTPAPDFISREERNRALERLAETRQGRETAGWVDYNSKDKSESFQAFLKAHRSKETWRNREAVERYRKEYEAAKKAAGMGKKPSADDADE